MIYDSSSFQFGAYLVQQIYRRISNKTKAKAVKKRLVLLAYKKWKKKSRDRNCKPKRHRRSKPPVNYLTSVWWEMLQDPRIKDPKSDEGKLFRRRFRVPFPVFERLTQIAVELGFPLRPRGANGRLGVPLKLKVLGVLRVLGRGT